MSWDAAFVAALGRRAVAPVYFVERLALNLTPGEPWAASSHPGYGLDAAIVAQSLSVSGSSVTPVDWSSTIGEWSFSVQAEDPRVLFASLKRGTPVRAWVSIGTASEVTDPQPVALGVVADISGTRGEFTVRCLDAGALLRSRLDRETARGPRLFGNVPAQTTLASTYTPGDTNIHVGGTSLFEKEAGGSGVIKITPASGADPFYLTWTVLGTSPTRVMGLSVAAVAGTTAVTSSSGSVVQCMVWLEGHPVDIARKVLTSTGNGSNGPWDVYPQSWGMALPYEHLDDTDAQEQADEVVICSASVAYAWTFVQEEAVDDAWSWLTGWLAAGGIWPCSRMGLVTLRGWQRSPLRSVGYAAEIDDDDIFEVEEWSAYDSDHPTEYQQVTVTGDGASSSSTLTSASTMPAEQLLTVDISDRAHTNPGNHCDDVLDRTEVPATVIPERLSLTVSLRLAGLCPGDRVSLTTGQCCSRARGADGYVDDEAFVAQVAPDWSSGYARIVLLVYPTE